MIEFILGGITFSILLIWGWKFCLLWGLIFFWSYYGIGRFWRKVLMVAQVDKKPDLKTFGIILIHGPAVWILVLAGMILGWISKISKYL